MKACGVCGRLYADDSGFCQADGQELISVSEAPVVDESDPRVGQLLASRYLVYRFVADGGMGRVYEGLDRHAERHVALKVLHAEVARDEIALARFEREYEVSRLLPHEHIVEVLDFQPTGDGSFVMVMEFLVGEELRATLRRERVLPPERVVRILSQVAMALDAAHEQKLVHRDLKPENIFLCQTRQGDIVKILDFGSAKDKSSQAKQLTVLGTTIGSPYYMAPEQAQGLASLDQRADVWALAVMVYECLSGGVPFRGPNGPSILVEILSKQPVPVSEAARGSAYQVPRTVDRVLARALRKSPAGRIATVGALADELGRAYGLPGDHRRWARASEAELGQRISDELPRLLSTGRSSIPPADPVDNFFGEVDALGAVEEPAVAAGPEESTEPSTGELASSREEPVRGVPAESRYWPWVILAVVLGISLVFVWVAVL